MVEYLVKLCIRCFCNVDHVEILIFLFEPSIFIEILSHYIESGDWLDLAQILVGNYYDVVFNDVVDQLLVSGVELVPSKFGFGVLVVYKAIDIFGLLRLKSVMVLLFDEGAVILIEFFHV